MLCLQESPNAVWFALYLLRSIHYNISPNLNFLVLINIMVHVFLRELRVCTFFGRYGSEISRISGARSAHSQLRNPSNQELIAVSDSDKLLSNIPLILLCVEGNTV